MKKQYRRYDEEFKRGLVAQIDGGSLTKAQAAREHGVAPTLIDRWRRQIHDGSMRPRPSPSEKQLERELEMYKRKVGELSVQVDLLKKLTCPGNSGHS
ncbi:MAG: transposase [Nitrospinota bacterium]|nr:transposase [Nitrospinota bacterium]